LFLRRRRRLRSASFDAFPKKSASFSSSCAFAREKWRRKRRRRRRSRHDDDDDNDEWKPDEFLSRKRTPLWKKNTTLSLSLLAPAERDEEIDLETEREQNNSALLFFNSLSSLSSLSSSFSVMNSSSLQRNERNDRIFPSTSKKKIVRPESKKQGKNLKNKQQKKKAFRSLHTHNTHAHK